MEKYLKEKKKYTQNDLNYWCRIERQKVFEEIEKACKDYYSISGIMLFCRRNLDRLKSEVNKWSVLNAVEKPYLFWIKKPIAMNVLWLKRNHLRMVKVKRKVYIIVMCRKTIKWKLQNPKNLHIV